ncbi:hypothetical protein HHI36_003362 [Cryptolaemus montrouzieri]|uniref:ADAMTS/ADAMTS-like cysteine-rich domain-containing protein n=1 Tax=Cryptolaemus montrouzieri TaxID=559131 RepID=A0ABD2PDL1_9CUCU
MSHLSQHNSYNFHNANDKEVSETTIFQKATEELKNSIQPIVPEKIIIMDETFRTKIDELKITVNNLVDSNEELIKMILHNQHHNGALSTYTPNHSNLIPNVEDNGETIPDLSDDLDSTSDTIINVNTGKAGSVAFIQKPRKRRQNSARGCIGLYKRIHLCNPQECPLGTRDFRHEQCASFNKRKYKGHSYIWEPFPRGDQECALNCRPIGMNFYATLNKTVIDGTPCLRPITSTGKAAPQGTRGVCVVGVCKVLGIRK